MKALVIGYGSIGKRHADILAELGQDVAVVSRRNIDHPTRFEHIDTAVQAFVPDYVIIASRTFEHRDDITALADSGFRGKLMIEKPIYESGQETIPDIFSDAKVAFNLRFHPALQRFRELLQSRNVHAVTAYAGSYLPDWRPDTDYLQGYSAIRAQGGGVLRDLSHELDYLQWIFGRWQRLSAIGGNLGSLGIDSDDVFSMLFETERVKSISLNLNYLDTTARRDVIALTDQGTVHLDLIGGIVETTTGSEIFTVERNDTYRSQHSAMLAGENTILCSLAEGFDVMSMIDAAEKAAIQGDWITA